jgi:hypothetical protein
MEVFILFSRYYIKITDWLHEDTDVSAWQGNMKGSAFAGLACHGYFPAMRSHDPPRYCQPQPGTACAAVA